MNAIELGAFDIQFIQACIVGMVRRAQERMPERQAIQTTTAAAETISRLNSAAINTQDVDFICLCIKKTIDCLETDFRMPAAAKKMTREKGIEIQNKFTRALHVPLPHIWNDRKRENDTSETPSAEVQIQ
jgi:hypothetical protein